MLKYQIRGRKKNSQESKLHFILYELCLTLHQAILIFIISEAHTYILNQLVKVSLPHTQAYSVWKDADIKAFVSNTRTQTH